MNTPIKSARRCITKLQSQAYKKFNKSLIIDTNQSEIINLFINTHGSIKTPLIEQNAGNNTILNRVIFASSGCVAFSSTIGNLKFINKLIRNINSNSFFNQECISTDDLKSFNDMVFESEKETSGTNTRYMEALPEVFEMDISCNRPYPKFLKHSLELQEGININNKYYDKMFTPFGLLTEEGQFGSGIFLLSDFNYSGEYDFKKEIETELLIDAKRQFKNDNFKDYDEFDDDDVEILQDTYNYLLKDENQTNKIYNILKQKPSQRIEHIIPKGTNLIEHPLFIEYIQNMNHRRELIFILNSMKEKIQVLEYVLLSEIVTFFKLKNNELKLFNIIDTSCEVLQNLSSNRERRCLLRDISKSSIRGGLRKYNKKYNKTKKYNKNKKYTKKYNKNKYIKGYRLNKTKCVQLFN